MTKYALANVPGDAAPSLWNIYRSAKRAYADFPAATENYGSDKDLHVLIFSDFIKFHEHFWLRDGACKIDQEGYLDALNALPPMEWEVSPDGIERFLTAEFLTAGITLQCASYSGMFARKNVVALDKATWITKAEILEVNNT